MTVQEAMETRRWCYYISPTQDSHETGGFVPSVVVEDFPGHYPAMGKGECAAPWVWGDTLKKAEATCRNENERKGISNRAFFEITTSSMRVSHTDKS